MMFCIRCRKWVSGSILVSYCIGFGMLVNGNMKFDSRIDGRNRNSVICIVWNCECVCVEISRFSVRLVSISSIVVRQMFSRLSWIGIWNSQVFSISISVVCSRLIVVQGSILLIISLLCDIGVVISSFMLLCLCLCIIVIVVNIIRVMVRIILIRLGMMFIVECCCGLQKLVMLIGLLVMLFLCSGCVLLVGCVFNGICVSWIVVFCIMVLLLLISICIVL